MYIYLIYLFIEYPNRKHDPIFGICQIQIFNLI